MSRYSMTRAQSPASYFRVILAAGLFAAAAPLAQAASLVGYWSFNEGVGSGAEGLETSGNNIGAAQLVNGDSHTASSAFGISAVDLNGTDQYISLANSLDSVRDLTAGTISFWVNLDSLSPVNRLFGSTAGNTNDFWRIAATGDGSAINLLMKNNGGDLIRADTSNGVLTTGSWQHIAYTSGSSGNALYVNGSAVTLTYNSGSTATQSFFEQIDGAGSDLGNLTFGRLFSGNAGVDGYTNGRMDDISIWNDALSSTEVAKLYNAGAVSSFTPWYFNTITTADDRGADTYIEYDSRFEGGPDPSSDKNYNDEGSFRIKAADDPDFNGSPEQLYRKGYLRFDLSSFNGEEFTDARLELTAFSANSTSKTFAIYAINDADAGDNDQDLGGYDPDGITWNNAPANDNINDDNDILANATLLGTFNGNAPNATAIFDDQALLDLLNADTDGMVTLIITSLGISSDFTSTVYQFYSSETSNADYFPRLVVSIVPEPSTFALLGLGAMALIRRRR